MKIHLILSFAFLLFIGSSVFAQHKIKAEEAKNYITPDTVVGKVFQIKTTEKMIYINIGGYYPDNPFTAVILKKDFDIVGDVYKYENKTIDVIGLLSVFNGKPEIIVHDASQLKLDK
ncbi:MAG: hypothetical protein ABR968_06200 [Bacteroidales bacterium]|jgi:hypothetical protein